MTTERFDYQDFSDKFYSLYLEMRREQELKGVVAIRISQICKNFQELNNMSESDVAQGFDHLAKNKVFYVDGALIEWNY